MEVLCQRCCGLDVHKKAVTACLVTPEGKEKRTFGTTTDALLELADWLATSGCTHVAMESTGVYWKPVYNLLESTGMEVLVVNAQHIKAVPGRKTDIKDAEWIVDLLRHGLLRRSFIPDRPQLKLQELVRYRRSLIQERSREVNRVQKVLEGANIKLGSVATNVLGVSGRAMLEALMRGEEDPSKLAALARGRLERALCGMLGAHQRMLLATQLRHVDFLDQEIAKLDAEIAEGMCPFKGDLGRLGTLPGVGPRTSEEIVAVIGTDMSRFSSAHHLASWAKMCPGNEESAPKRRSGRTGRGNPLLRGALLEAAWAASHTRTPTSAPTTTASPPDVAGSVPSLPLDTRSCSSSTASSRTRPLTRTSARTTSSARTKRPRCDASSVGSRLWAIASRSTRSPEPGASRGIFGVAGWATR